MEKISILAITKNGIRTGLKIKESFPSWEIFAPAKFSDENPNVVWFTEPTSSKIEKLFKDSQGLVCLFSLGAVIRLITPHLRDKKTDPAVIVIDDGANFVISVLSGHLGGANQLTNEIAVKLDATPVITTAADVNKTIAVDLVGREFGWEIEDSSEVTKISAFMVNEEKIGIYQDAGQKDWWKKELPKNVTTYDSLDELNNSESKAALIISDRIIDTGNVPSVVYRPKTLVVGVGLHQDTTKETIQNGLGICLEKFSLSPKSIAGLASIKKPRDVQGLADFAKKNQVPLECIKREDLAEMSIPNPSETVRAFEGTPSVSEAAAILVSKGSLIVEKQKFPPDLTIAIARISY